MSHEEMPHSAYSIEEFQYEDGNYTDCTYMGTEQVEVKIYLIGVFATFIAVLSILFNSFFTLVFIRNNTIRKSSVYYFGILAVIDAIMAVNYIAVMSLPVYVDFYHLLPLYYLFLWYCRVVLTESHCVMFASVLLILLATTERLLRTFNGKRCISARSKLRLLEKNRPFVCFCCILLAIVYKICGFWEIDVLYKEECPDGWSQYEIVAGPLVQYRAYRIWWMFVTRNVVDRLIPFCVLVTMNYFICKALKKEFKRQSFKPSDRLSDKNGNLSPKTHRGNLRDATRALISIVSMYLMSQALQVVLTVWETVDRQSLESEQLAMTYSYLNDIVSILTLLSSCLRFPVYCMCNRLIKTASKETLRDLKCIFCKPSGKPTVYSHINSGSSKECGVPDSEQVLEGREANIVYNEKLQEWQL